MPTATLHSLALSFPDRIVENDELKAEAPHLFEQAESHSLSRAWSRHDGPSLRFDEAMAPYLSDPFRGAKRRRWRGPGESALSLELSACRQALEAARLRAGDVDLLVCSSFFPDMWGVGNAAPLAEALGLAGPAWNLESACASAIVSLGVADGLIAAGRARNVLAVTSCSYSAVNLPDDTLRWGNGDGAAAFVLTADDGGARLLGHAARNTSVTNGAVRTELIKDAGGDPFVQMAVDREGGRVLRETAEPFLTETLGAALDDAGLPAEAIARYVFPTPTAWYATFCADVCGLADDDVVNAHPETANTGPVLTPTNLYFMARRRALAPGERVALYAVGSVSNASAAVLEWGEVALGEEPPGFASLL